MTQPLRLSLLLPLLLLASGCGSVSKLTRESADAPLQIADAQRVEVVDFTASDARQLGTPEKQAEYEASVSEARRVFADHIAEAISETGAFASVSRTPGPAEDSLRVSGDITVYDEGNIVARGLTGFAGRTRFDATVNFSDARSGAVLSTMTIDRNSWPLPVGASLSTLQTTNFFMKEAAKKIAEELAAKKKAPASGG